MMQHCIQGQREAILRQASSWRQAVLEKEQQLALLARRVEDLSRENSALRQVKPVLLCAPGMGVMLPVILTALMQHWCPQVKGMARSDSSNADRGRHHRQVGLEALQREAAAKQAESFARWQAAEAEEAVTAAHLETADAVRLTGAALQASSALQRANELLLQQVKPPQLTQDGAHMANPG